MIGKIADLILEHVYKMQFVCEDERKSLRLDLYKDAEKLYQQDPISFARGSLLLLNESVPLLETENYRVKMECAQIWHKNSFDIWVFRIRYYLNLDLAINTQLLAQKIKAAFSCYENNFMKRHDARSGYERLFLQILPSNESEDQNLRAALETILTPDLACDVLGVIAYVAIKNQSKDRKDIPAYMKTIYLAVTSFSVIEGGGLCGWVIENKVGTLRSAGTAWKKLGFLNASKILRDLYEILKDKPTLIQHDEISDKHLIEQIEIAEKNLLNCVTMEELMAAAERYISENAGPFAAVN